MIASDHIQLALVGTFLIAVLVRFTMPNIHEFVYYAIIFTPLMFFLIFAPREKTLDK